MTITATQLRKLFYYDPETGAFTRLGVGKSKVGSRNGGGYLQIQISGKLYGAQRLAWLYMTGKWPKRQIDHANMVTDDNRWRNLREASGSQNRANTIVPSNSSSGIKGAWYIKSRDKWRSGIHVNGKKIYLGYFGTPEAANSAYLEAAKTYFKEFARAA